MCAAGLRDECMKKHRKMIFLGGKVPYFIHLFFLYANERTAGDLELRMFYKD